MGNIESGPGKVTGASGAVYENTTEGTDTFTSTDHLGNEVTDDSSDDDSSTEEAVENG